MRSLRLKQIWVQWTNWEYWPLWLSNLPIFGFYLWYAAKARHLLFFSAANPAIPLGGAIGESKYDILRRIPAEVLPKMLFVPAGTLFDSVVHDLKSLHIVFPLIAKPNVGERGFLVRKINSADELRQHLTRYPIDFILQVFVDLPFEATVLYHFFPGPNGPFRITSVCVKEFLSITGDGRRSMRSLIMDNPRASFQLQRLQQEYAGELERILDLGEQLPLGVIGNHCLGTKFLNGNHLIDEQLTKVFEPLCRQIEGVAYGRFDLKSEHQEALRNGRFLIMELNGVLGEPAHVYDPAMGARRAYRDFRRHWGYIYAVSQANQQAGITVATLRDGWSILKQYFAYKRQLE